MFAHEGLKPALAGADGHTIPFFNEYPDGVSSKSQAEFAKLTPADSDRAWAGVCSLKAVQAANVVARTGYRPVFMGKGPAISKRFLWAVGEAEVVRVEPEGGVDTFATFVWWFDPGYLRYLRFRGDQTAFNMMSKALRLLPDVLEALGGAEKDKLSEGDLLRRLDAFDVSLLKTQLKDVVAAAVADAVVRTKSIASPYPSAVSLPKHVSAPAALKTEDILVEVEGAEFAEGWWVDEEGEDDMEDTEDMEDMDVGGIVESVPAAVTVVNMHFKAGFLNKTASLMIRHATKLDPAFSRLPFNKRAELIAEAGKRYSSNIWVHHMAALIKRGEFVPRPGETHEQQVVRVQAETQRKRVNRPKGREGEIAGVCVLCGFEFIKYPAAQGVVHAGAGCTSKMRAGWHYVERDGLRSDVVFPVASVYWGWIANLAAPGTRVKMDKHAALASFKAYANASTFPGQRNLLQSLAGGGNHAESLKRALEFILGNGMHAGMPGNPRIQSMDAEKAAARRRSGGRNGGSKHTNWFLHLPEN
ncbi:hypothetical protein HK101_001331 [Irineochytrium annulatum]|nr:hypothetical protein HK101_001331 [Irineochytrium annulatum]